jgi:hypothetical protein
MMREPEYEEMLSNKYAPEGWGAGFRTPSHLRPQAAGEYLTSRMVPKLWAEIWDIQNRKRTGDKTWLVK